MKHKDRFQEEFGGEDDSLVARGNWLELDVESRTLSSELSINRM